MVAVCPTTIHEGTSVGVDQAIARYLLVGRFGIEKKTLKELRGEA